jgi:hypothetical protein
VNSWMNQPGGFTETSGQVTSVSPLNPAHPIAPASWAAQTRRVCGLYSTVTGSPRRTGPPEMTSA